MSLNSLSGAGGNYYPGLYSSTHGARNKHVGGFGEDSAASNANAASNADSTNAAASNLTQYAPQATAAAQQAGSATDTATSPSSAQQVNNTSPTQGTNSISSAFAPEQSILTNLIGKSLEAMGLVSQSDLSNTNISFDSMSYGVESSVSAAAGVQGQQVGAEVDESQSADLQGQGQITLADGTVYDFQIELQVGDELQASGSQTLGGTDGSQSAGDSSNPLSGLLGSGSDGTQGAQAASGASGDSSSSSDISSNYLAQLVAAMVQTASQSLDSNPNSFLQGLGSTTSSGNQGASTSGSTTGAGAAPSINWDAIQSQTSNLIDMLDAMISSNQSANSSASSTAANASASSSAAAAASNAASTTQSGSTTATNTNPVAIAA